MRPERPDTLSGSFGSGSVFQDFDESDQLSLLEIVDHVLNQGLVISGEITIAVADIDLLYVGLNVLLGSVDTIDRVLAKRQPPEEIQGET